MNSVVPLRAPRVRKLWIGGSLALGTIPLLYYADDRMRQTPIPSTHRVPAAIVDSVDPQTHSPQSLLQLAIDRYREVEDYRCTVTSANLLKGRLENNVLHVMHKRPGMFRHTIVDGENRGVVLVQDANGQIRVRPGGLLGVMTVKMDAADQRLCDGRGIPFYQTDWGSELARFQQSPSLTRVDAQSPEDWCLETEEDELRHRIWIDHQTHLPLRVASFRGVDIIRDARYSDIAINTGLTEDEFLLR